MMSTYAEWYRHAMASGEVVPVNLTPLPVPVVVPVNLIAGDGREGGENGEQAVYAHPTYAHVGHPAMMMGHPDAYVAEAMMPPHGAADYAAALAAQAEYFSTMQYHAAAAAAAAQYYGYAPPYGVDPYGANAMDAYGANEMSPPGGLYAGPNGRVGNNMDNQWRRANSDGSGGGRHTYHGRHSVSDERAGGRGSPNTVFVKEIPASVSERELAETFAACGRIVDCRMCRDANSNKFSYAFMAFETADEVQNALSLDKMSLHGKNIVVRRSDTAVIPVNPLLLPQNEAELESTARTIYVANVDKSVDSNALKTFFERHAGAVNRLHLQVKNAADANVAFVEFVNLESAASSLRLTGKQLGQRVVRVSASKTPLRVNRRMSEQRAMSYYASGTNGDAATPPAPTKVYISNIPKNLSPGTLRAMFSECGRVTNVELLNNPKSKFPYAFVEFDDAESAKRALDFRGREVQGCAINIELTYNKKRRGAPRLALDPLSVDKMERTVFVTDIDPDLEPSFVRSKFEDECGPVTLFWYKAFEKGEKQALAYIEFTELSSVEKALNQCRTHFLGESRLIKVRHSHTPLVPKDDDQGMCYSPALDSPVSSTSGAEDAGSEGEKSSVVRDLITPMAALAQDPAVVDKATERLEQLTVNNPAA